MEYTGKLKKIQGNDVLINTYESINLNYLKMIYGSFETVEPKIVFEDKRKITTKQRALFYALAKNCALWFGYEKETMENYFKIEYLKKTQRLISLSDISKDSRSDINNFLNYVVDFMFEFNVPFTKGYELLPKNEQWYLYQCCKHRKCAVSGLPAEIHHINTVGSGNNRNKIDHTKKLVISLSRKYHSEAHTIGDDRFLEKYKLAGIYLSYQDFNDLGMMSQKLIDELENRGE